MKLSITRRQQAFIDASADEVLFGGAAGGGKSFGQVIDAFLYALKYPGSKQILFRRTFPELDKSIIRTALEVYPREVFRYNASSHTGRFANGSILDFGYCDNEKDVYRYQSAEFDVIRFDELTHFTEDMYIYLLSRLRGANDFPKSVKSSTNPGGVGHTWVKERFIDIGPPDRVHRMENGTRLFLPSKIQDNFFLMKRDPHYLERLHNLSEKDKKALLYGEWDIFDGQYFEEFSREKHVVAPFEIPADWRVYRAMDYGLDMLAVLWIAVDSLRRCYVFRELCRPNTVISDGARLVRELTDEQVRLTYAPPDLWTRSQESGRSKADLFREGGLVLHKSSNNREAGWLCIKELLRPDSSGEPRLKIFSTCTELIRCLPALQYDSKKPTDCATEPHEITHAPDALRYFAVQHIRPPVPEPPKRHVDFEFQKPKKERAIGTDLNKFLRR